MRKLFYPSSADVTVAMDTHAHLSIVPVSYFSGKSTPVYTDEGNQMNYSLLVTLSVAIGITILGLIITGVSLFRNRLAGHYVKVPFHESVMQMSYE